MKSWFLEKINKIDKPVATLTKKERTQNQKEREERDVITDTTETQRIIRDCYEQLYANWTT